MRLLSQSGLTLKSDNIMLVHFMIKNYVLKDILSQGTLHNINLYGKTEDPVRW